MVLLLMDVFAILEYFSSVYLQKWKTTIESDSIQDIKIGSMIVTKELSNTYTCYNIYGKEKTLFNTIIGKSTTFRPWC